MNSVGASMALASQMARQRDEFLDSPFAAHQRRNERCACGSGKKFKKCCMGKTLREVFDAEGGVPGRDDGRAGGMVRL